MQTKHPLALLLFASASLGGCYKTAVSTPLPPGQPKHSERQSFLLAGLVPLSSPAGKECTEGVTRTDSSYNAVDFLISLGVGAGGALIGASVCDSADRAEYSACISTSANAAALLIGTRTVEYNCRESAPANFSALGPQLPPQGTYTPAPAPAANPAPGAQTYPPQPAPQQPYPQQPAPRQPYPQQPAPQQSAPQPNPPQPAPQQPYPQQPTPQPAPAPTPQ